MAIDCYSTTDSHSHTHAGDKTHIHMIDIKAQTQGYIERERTRER